MSTYPPFSSINLKEAMKKEGENFQEYYLWLENAMSEIFFEEVKQENLLLITHSLMGFDLQDYFSIINLKSAAIALCLDSSDADLRILSHFTHYGIKNYQVYVSKKPAPFLGIKTPLRISILDFTEAVETTEKVFPLEIKLKIENFLKKQVPGIDSKEFEALFKKMNSRFLMSLSIEQLKLAFSMLYRAQFRDSCQYKVHYEKEWEQKKISSLYVVLAWRHTPKHNFLYRLAHVVHRHQLTMKKVNATYTDPYSTQSIFVMALSIHGSNGEAAWEVADIADFLREMTTIKYFDTKDLIEEQLVNCGLITGNMGNLLRAMSTFIYQALVQIDSNLYSIDNIMEALCCHPELVFQLCESFKFRFEPTLNDPSKFIQIRKQFLIDLAQLDSGQETNDSKRKIIFYQAMNFICHVLKTNFYRLTYTALSFRLDPNYMNEIPFDRHKNFPELPYAIFFICGMNFFGFHIRFKDLARGGLRTVYPEQIEQMLAERDHVFTECYNLAWTQHKKNKDIPEGGAKGIIFLKSFAQVDSESAILKKELEESKISAQEIESHLNTFRQQQKVQYLYQSQRAFIDSLLTIVNCDSNGKIRARYVVDYWKRPEYLYLGPDENMHDSMIEWIANFSKKYHYQPGEAFISSKPVLGFNHKEYGVTSLGLNVYMHQVLKYLGINPFKEIFSIKMSGGPDGDVAGNQLLNLYRFYPQTAKLTALTDGTGTIYDKQGIDLEVVKDLFYQNKGISFYPPEKLSCGGFLVDKKRRRFPNSYMQETLCWRRLEDQLVEDWLSGSDTHHLLRFNVHQAKTDIFIPAGGRPCTLNETNIQEFLDETGKPSSRAIIEGANLYLNTKARHFLEEKGVLIIKDSSANKGGVICSSFEVLCSLTLDEKSFTHYRHQLIKEILERLKTCSENEAHLLLRTNQKTNEHLTKISDRISEKINRYTYQILEYLDTLKLNNQPQDPLIRCFLNYCLPTLRYQFPYQLLDQIPDHHKKAIVACHLAAYMVYHKGLDWSPSIVDILPLLLSAPPFNS